jgi:hypothetical protein
MTSTVCSLWAAAWRERASIPTAPTVVFRNLTIQHGKAQGGNGSGGGAGLGGGMFVYDGHVTVQNVTFAHNAAQGGNRQ